jgi:hypothetical protein
VKGGRGAETRRAGELSQMIAANTDSSLNLRQLHLADEYLNVLAEKRGPDSRFRFKHVDDELDLGALFSLREAGLIEPDETFDWGRATNWCLTNNGELAVDRLQAGTVSDELLDALDDHSVDVLNRHFDLLLELPSESEFQAKEHEALCGSLLGALNRAGLLDRVEKNLGEPDVWELSAFARLVTATASTNEAPVEPEEENE